MFSIIFANFFFVDREEGIAMGTEMDEYILDTVNSENFLFSIS